jgi:hypothetical protein
MRPYDVLHGIVEKFTPIPKSEASQLQTEAVNEYHKVKKDYDEIVAHNIAEDKKANDDVTYSPQYKRVNIKHKIIRFCEQWWVRYIMSILFIFLLRGIQNWLTAAPESEKEDEMDVFQEFLKFKRMSN